MDGRAIGPRLGLVPRDLVAEADPVGGVAAVGDQPDRLAHQAHRVGQRHGGRHGQLRTARLVLRGVAVAVEVEHDRRAGDRRGVVDLAVQDPGAGRGRPVDAVERVAGLVVPDAGDPRRVLEQAVRQPDLADRPTRRHVVARQRHDLGIDHDVHRLGHDPEPPVQAEQVAGLQHHRPDLVIPAHGEVELIIQRLPPVRPEHRHGQPMPLHLDARGPRDDRPARQHVLDQHPGDRQPAAVAAP